MAEFGLSCKLTGLVLPSSYYIYNWVVISGHPWILFYTERTLKTLSIKSKLKNQVGTTSCESANAVVSELHGNKVGNGYLGEGLNRHLFSSSLSCNSEEQDECGLVDALAVAISHVKISEPKRTRLCGPTGPIEQQCSSNMTANNLCRAFWSCWQTDTTNIIISTVF